MMGIPLATFAVFVYLLLLCYLQFAIVVYAVYDARNSAAIYMRNVNGRDYK